MYSATISCLDFRALADILKPLSDIIAALYIDFLPRLVYPVRSGEHTNTAFGLIFALEYSRLVGDKTLENSIVSAAKRFYGSDRLSPLSYEPSGYDFLSPSLQEAELMAMVIKERDEYYQWLSGFLPQLLREDFVLAPAEVLDRTDGKLVHLDGLNFSRAWNLFKIASKLKSKGKLDANKEQLVIIVTDF